MDEDLLTLSAQALREEVRKLRGAVRLHRDTSEHELCWQAGCEHVAHPRGEARVLVVERAGSV